MAETRWVAHHIASAELFETFDRPLSKQFRVSSDRHLAHIGDARHSSIQRLDQFAQRAYLFPVGPGHRSRPHRRRRATFQISPHFAHRQ
jgi:hypothetical protein